MPPDESLNAFQAGSSYSVRVSVRIVAGAVEGAGWAVCRLAAQAASSAGAAPAAAPASTRRRLIPAPEFLMAFPIRSLLRLASGDYSWARATAPPVLSQQSNAGRPHGCLVPAAAERRRQTACAPRG